MLFSLFFFLFLSYNGSNRRIVENVCYKRSLGGKLRMIQDIGYAKAIESKDKIQIKLIENSMVKVALCDTEIKVLSNVTEENEIVRLIYEDSSFFEQLNIMSAGLARGEKQFSFEYYAEDTERYYLLKVYYGEEVYEFKYPCFYLIATEITQYKRELMDTKRQNTEYKMIMNTISNGILMVEITKQCPLYWASGRFYEMLGYTEQQFLNRFGSSGCTFVEEDDREQFIENIHSCIGSEVPLEQTIRIENLTGEHRWFHVRFERVKENKKVAVAFCVFSDATEEVQRDQELKSFQERYKMILSVTSEVVFEYDVKSKTMNYFGGDKNTLQRPAKIDNFFENLQRLGINGGKLTEESREDIYNLFEMFEQEDVDIGDTYLCYEFEDGRVQWIYLIGKCIRNSENEAELIIGKISDMTSYKEEEKKLLIKASTDSLTKVYNRDYTVEDITRYLSVCGKNILPTLLILDIDDFKLVNNNYGHAEGDLVLTQIAEVLKGEFRSTDVIGRIGGDEFVVFLKDIVSEDIVYEKASNVCKKISETIKNVTVSVGVSIMEEKNASFEKLYRHADIALYQAKERGKNTFVCYHQLSNEVKKRAETKRVNVKELATLEGEYGQASYEVSFDCFSKSVLDSYEYLFGINLTEDKIRRFYNENNTMDGQKFNSYTELFEHLYDEIYDEDERFEFESVFRQENLIGLFLEGEYQVHGYFRVFNEKQEFHWYFIEALLHDTDIKNGIHCTFLLKDVQKSRTEEMRRFELQTQNRFVRELEDEKILDSLTGVYKPNKFYETAKEHLQLHPEKKYAIISFDIDGFRVINDIYSEAVGDRIICYIADVLRNLEVEDKIYGRYFAECFNLMITYQSRQDIIDVINQIKAKCMEVQYVKTGFKMSFGVYAVIDHNAPVRLMCDWARLAGRTVKGLSMQYYAFYNEEYRNELVETQKIEARMHKALKNEEFKMYLQPKYDLRTNQVVGAEALVRWYHPKDGIIYPNKFIPLFEKNGFILELDEYMWEQACKVIKEWQLQGIDLPISVNISRLHTYDAMLVTKLTNLVNKYEIPVHLLELEFTEGLFMENVQTLYTLMENLKSQGFVLQMDDFGSGYSSLNMLKNVPIDVIKLDKAFFEDMLVNERGKIIIENSIKMIHDLKLRVMAEGIESKEHVEFLNKSNCVTGQGYYYAKPMPLEEFNDKYVVEK